MGFPLRENGCSVVDFDDGLEYAREFYNAHREICRVLVLTRRGIHFYFSGTIRTRKCEHGDIKGNGYTVFPPSTVDGHEYRFVSGYEWGNELAPFPEHLFTETREEVSRAITRKQVTDVRSYLAKVESIQGQGGSRGLVRAAAICRDAGLTESEATFVLIGWNMGPTVQPPWTPQELARAITNVYRKQLA